VRSNGDQADDETIGPSISADGRYVAFESYATNLVDDDTNGTSDIFVHDRQTGDTERVSVRSNGDEANEQSYAASISADGRYVAFFSEATDLVDDDNNGTPDVFVHDRQTGDTERVSVLSNGDEADGFSFNPSISADGRYVAFPSYATNLVDDDTNGDWDVFVHDRQTGTTERVSVHSNGDEANEHSYVASISADGRYVAFESDATNLVDDDGNGLQDVFVHDRGAEVTPAPTPSPTPTPSPGPELTQGNVDCDQDVDSVDALKQLRHVAAMPVSQEPGCPEIGSEVASLFGDVDCDNDVDSVDALKVLRYVAGLGVQQSEPCTDIGQALG
jgi:Tol biopolymer transport system component